MNGNIVSVRAYTWYSDTPGVTRMYRVIYFYWVNVCHNIGDESDAHIKCVSVSISYDAKSVAFSATYTDEDGEDDFESVCITVCSKINNARVKVGQYIDGEADDDHLGWYVSISSYGNNIALVLPDYYCGHMSVYSQRNGYWVNIGQYIGGECGEDR